MTSLLPLIGSRMGHDAVPEYYVVAVYQTEDRLPQTIPV